MYYSFYLSTPSLLDIFDRYDFFKRELLKTAYFDDNMACHVTASFGAVCDISCRLVRNVDRCTL